MWQMMLMRSFFKPTSPSTKHSKRFFSIPTLKKVLLLVGASLVVEYVVLTFAYRFSPLFPDEWPTLHQLSEEVHLILVTKSIGLLMLLIILLFAVWRPKFRTRLGDIFSVSGGTLEYVFCHAGMLGEKGICVKDSSLKILLCNSRLLTRFGLTADKVVGKLGREVFPPYFVEKIEYLENMALATKKAQTIELLDDSVPHTNPRATSVRVTAIPVYYPKGDFAGMFFVSENASNQKKAEYDNFTALSHYRKLINHLPIGVLLCEGWFEEDGHPQFKVLEANAAAHQIYEDEMQLADASPGKFMSFFDQDPALQAGLSRIITRGEPFKYEFHHPYLGKTLSCMFAGMDSKFIWLIYDVTDKNTTETQILHINDNLRRLKEVQHQRLEDLLQDTNMFMMTVADLLQPPIEKISETQAGLAKPQQEQVDQALNEIQGVLEKMLMYVNFSQVPAKKKLISLDTVATDLIETVKDRAPQVTFKVEPLPQLITSQLMCHSIFTCTLQALLPLASSDCVIRFSFDASCMQPLVFVAATGINESGLLLDDAPTTWADLDWNLTDNLELAQARRLSSKNGGSLKVRKLGDELQIGFIANLSTTAH